MKTIRILGTKPYGHPFPIVSWIIRLIEWSKQSHVVIHDLETNEVKHARFNDIITQDYDEYMKKNVITEAYEFEISDKEYDRLTIFTNAMMGKQEGYWATLLGVLIPQTLRTLSKDRILLKNFFPHGLTCSWFIYLSMIVAGDRCQKVFEKQIVEGSALCTDDILISAKKMLTEN